jgi:hypothetical protein
MTNGGLAAKGLLQGASFEMKIATFIPAEDILEWSAGVLSEEVEFVVSRA